MKTVKTIEVIDLLNEIKNGNYSKIQQMKMYKNNRRIYYDKSLGCNLGSIKFCDNNMKVIHSNMNLLEAIQIREDILDAKEKEWLRHFIKSVKMDVISIEKRDINGNEERLYINYIFKSKRLHGFPPFEKGTMYKNMKPNKEYTLAELEL